MKSPAPRLRVGVRVAMLAGLMSLLPLVSAPAHAATQAATCTPTGFVRDNINLTAAVIDPTNTYTSTVDATGCNIGVYYGPGATGTLTAHVFGANYFGVVNDGGHITINQSYIHNIGEVPLNGDQHGVGIYFNNASGATGNIYSTVVWNYQKAGIVVNGAGDSAVIYNDTVLGQGPVNYIAQNGIQIGYGATGTIARNVVTGNSYTGDALSASGGILIVGGSCYGGPATVGVKIGSNVLLGNDVGVWLSNIDVDPNNTSLCQPTAVVTKDVVGANIIMNDAVNNTSGYGVVGSGYQAGISDQGNYDYIASNSICGVGYTPVATPPPYLYAIDTTATNNPTVLNNTSCSGSSSLSVARPASQSGTRLKASATR